MVHALEGTKRTVDGAGSRRMVLAAIFLCSVVALLLIVTASACAAPQVIVELQQNHGADITYPSTFAGQPIGGTDNSAKQAYKFQRQREGKYFTYAIGNLDPGTTYSVALSFVEHDFQSPGQRRFNAYVQGAKVMNNFDICAQVGPNNACQGTWPATTDSRGVLSVVFRSDEPGCQDNATISTIRVYRGAADAVEVNASVSRSNLTPQPVRHYNTGTQNTYEAILGRLGSRASLDLLPQRLSSRFSTLGTWTGDESDLVIALKYGTEIRALPLTDRFPAFENITQSETMTGVTFACSSSAMPFELTATFRAPFYPRDQKVSCAPFFYIDISVKNTGSRPATASLVLARPHKEALASADIQHFSDGTATGLTSKTTYSYQEETLTRYNSKAATEAIALPAGEASGVEFRGNFQAEFSDFTSGALWGWSYPGYPDAPGDPKIPLFSFNPRGYSGARWSASNLAAGATASKHFVLAGYTSDRILNVRNRFYQDSAFKFLYTTQFAGVLDVADYAVGQRSSGDDIEGKSLFFDYTVASDDSLMVDPRNEASVRNLIACSFRTYLTNTWWAHSASGRDWFSVWEGTWMRFHGTVDVEYNQAWVYYEFWPSLMRTIFEEWLLYTKSNETGQFVSHDVGIYDQATGQAYDHDMPVEENLNFILMLYRYWKASGDTAYVSARFGNLQTLAAFVAACDTNGNGLPDKYCPTTFDDGTPALERGEDQAYLGFKWLAACRAMREMALAVGSSSANGYQSKVELINQTLEHDMWLSDHYAVCLDGTVEDADREAYSIHTGNGLLLLLGGQRDNGVTSTNMARLRQDVEAATARTWGTYGSKHTSYDPGRMWVSANIWRDAVAGYVGARPRGESPIAAAGPYWALEQYLGMNASGGYWDGIIYGQKGEGGSGGAAPMGIPPPAGIIAERPTYFDYNGWTGGTDVVGATNPASVFYFAEGTTRPGFDPYLCIQNPEAGEADVKITYMLGTGATRVTTLAVAPHSRATLRARDTLGTGNDTAHDFSAKVEVTNGTAGSPLMSYYPRGTASLGLIDAEAGLIIDTPENALYYAPQDFPLRVPVFNRADWANPDPSRRVPLLYFPSRSSAVQITNPGLLPATVRPAGYADLGNVTVTGDPLDLSATPGTGATISYDLPVASKVTTSIWDGSTKVRSYSTQHQPAGRRSFTWDGKGSDGKPVGDGIYFARIDAVPDDAGHAIRPASAEVRVNSTIPGLSKDWYFAEGYTGATAGAGRFEEYILVQNPGDHAASVKATFMRASGGAVARSFNIAAKSRLTINVGAVVPNAEVSAHIASDVPVACERSMYFNGRRAGHDSIGVNSPGTTWYLPEGCTRAGFDEFVLVQNPGASPATITATFAPASGAPVSRQYTVAPGSRFTIPVNDIMPNADVSTTVTSDNPVVVERSQYLNNMTAGTCSIAARSASRTWYLAEGYTDGGFEEYVLVQNPQARSNAFTLKFMKPDGTDAIRSYTAAPRSRFTVAVDDVLPASEVSIEVRAQYPLVVERAMYWNNRSDGHASIGTTTSDSRWYIPEGYTGGGFETYVLVQNPGDAARMVTATFMEPSGKNTVRKYTLAPRSRFTIAVNSILPAAEVSTLIDADGPVIVEKAMYFNNRSGGTGSIGIR
jgi:hypothetical protein